MRPAVAEQGRKSIRSGDGGAVCEKRRLSPAVVVKVAAAWRRVLGHKRIPLMRCRQERAACTRRMTQAAGKNESAHGKPPWKRLQSKKNQLRSSRMAALKAVERASSKSGCMGRPPWMWLYGNGENLEKKDGGKGGSVAQFADGRGDGQIHGGADEQGKEPGHKNLLEI